MDCNLYILALHGLKETIGTIPYETKYATLVVFLRVRRTPHLPANISSQCLKLSFPTLQLAPFLVHYSLEELRSEEAMLVAFGEDDTVAREVELYTCIESFLYVDVYQDACRVPHPYDGDESADVYRDSRWVIVPLMTPEPGTPWARCMWFRVILLSPWDSAFHAQEI